MSISLGINSAQSVCQRYHGHVIFEDFNSLFQLPFDAMTMVMRSNTVQNYRKNIRGYQVFFVQFSQNSQVQNLDQLCHQLSDSHISLCTDKKVIWSYIILSASKSFAICEDIGCSPLTCCVVKIHNTL